MNALADIQQTFFAESISLLADMESALLRLEADPGDREAVHAVFRCAHTLKGSAGLFDLRHVVEFTHQAETLLDRARSERLAIDADLVELLLAGRDHLQQLLHAAQQDCEPEARLLAEGERLREAMAAHCDAAAAGLPILQATEVRREAGRADPDCWHISLRCGRDLFRSGHNPASWLRCLGELGELVHLSTLADALPAAAVFDPESCYLGLEIRLRSEASKASIEDVFEFVRDDCQLRILPPGSRIEDYLRLIDELPEQPQRLGELLLACGALTARELETILARQQAQREQTDSAPPLGELAVAAELAPAEVVQAALHKQREHRARAGDALVRVQARKLDALIDRVGELVIASAGVGQMAHQLGESGLHEAAASMARLVEDIRDDAMRLRMVEIGETFSRFRRIVRDVSRQLGKDIELQIEGADTELDKSLVEQITDPLTHLVRNAIDHGIEPADRREARGKPACGRLRLAARHEAGHVLIEVEDDGGGLDRERILAKARQRGLLDDGQALADAEVWNLIFEPGFSTAEVISDLSGRGVGMDVVKRSIETLRGSIEIVSVAGRGSCFRIRLPLTLAIIDGFLMGVADSYYVAPLDAVIECVELEPGAAERGYLNLRGEVLPLLPLREHFGLDGGSSRRRSVVVVNCLGRKAGLVVDRLEGELQAVIKPLGSLFTRLVGIAGTTILGSGAIALVLDIVSLLGNLRGCDGRSSQT